MTKKTKSPGNIFFLLFSAIGFITIFAMDITSELNVIALVPTGLVVVYTLIISILIKKSENRELSEHYAETIYFLGFIYTLIAFFVLLYKLRSIFTIEQSTISQYQFGFALLYIGIAVTTTIAGVLFRNIVKSSLLRQNAQDEDDFMLKKIEELKKYSEDFTNTYHGVFNDIKQFLNERREEVELLSRKENEYIKSLENFNNTVDRFCSRLSDQEKILSDTIGTMDSSLKRQEASFLKATSMMDDLSQAIGNVNSEVRSLSFKPISEDLHILKDEINELDVVLDSIIEIITTKIENLN